MHKSPSPPPSASLGWPRRSRIAILLLLLVTLAACSGDRAGRATLQVAVDGLPAAATADITVTGAGSSWQTGGAAPLELPAGNYLVAASPVTGEGGEYVPSPAEQSVDLQPGETRTVTVGYTAGAAPAVRRVPGSAGGDSVELAGGPVLQGVLWNDADGDGVFGRGDSVLPHAEVILELAGGERLRTVTDRVGQYRFTGLEPNTGFTLYSSATAADEGFRTQSANSPQAGKVRHYTWQ